MAELLDESVIKLAFKKDDFISKADRKLISDFDEIEKKIFNEVKRQINKMNVEGGKISFDDTNTDLVNQLNGVVANAIQSSPYPSNVNDFLRSFETIKEFNSDIHKSVNDLSSKELEDLINPIQRQTVQQTLQGLTGSGVNTNFTDPLKEGIFKNIVAGSSKTDLEQFLSNYILTDPERLGVFKRYVTQMSRDALNQFDGQVNSRIAEEFGLDAFQYVGSLIEDSRPQCRRWVAKGVLLKDELEKELSFAYNSGSGMIPGTNSENFAVYRGGYNCRHSAIPFKLTKRERERLGLEAKKEEEIQVETQKAQIKEVKRTIEKNEEKSQEETKVGKLNPNLFLSKQPASINEKGLEVLTFADDLNGIANERGMLITFRSPSESASAAGTRKFLDSIGSTATPWQISTMSKHSGGNCAINNSFLNIKVKKGEFVEFKKIDLDLSDESIESLKTKFGLKEGLTKNREKCLYNSETKEILIVNHDKPNRKFWSVSTPGGKNIAPTITHEAGHGIQNKHDRSLEKFNKIFTEKKLRLTDAVTVYGETNKFEFWTESFSAYVYDNEGLKTRNPKVFEFVEEYLDAIGVDRSTIKIAK